MPKKMRNSKRIRNSKRMRRKSRKLLKGGSNNLQKRYNALRNNSKMEQKLQNKERKNVQRSWDVLMDQPRQRRQRRLPPHGYGRTRKTSANSVRLGYIVKAAKEKKAAKEAGKPILKSIPFPTQDELDKLELRGVAMAVHKPKPKSEPRKKAENPVSLSPLQRAVREIAPDFVKAVMKVELPTTEEMKAKAHIKLINAYAQLSPDYKKNFLSKTKSKQKEIGILRKFFNTQYKFILKKKLYSSFNWNLMPGDKFHLYK